MTLTLEADMFGRTNPDRDLAVIRREDGTRTFTQSTPTEHTLEKHHAVLENVFGSDETMVPVEPSHIQVDSANGSKTAINRG